MLDLILRRSCFQDLERQCVICFIIFRVQVNLISIGTPWINKIMMLEKLQRRHIGRQNELRWRQTIRVQILNAKKISQFQSKHHQYLQMQKKKEKKKLKNMIVLMKASKRNKEAKDKLLEIFQVKMMILRNLTLIMMSGKQ